MFEMALTLAEIKDLAENAGFFIDMEKSHIEDYEKVKDDPEEGLVLMQKVAPKGFCFKRENGTVDGRCTTCARAFDTDELDMIFPLAEERG